MPRCGCRCSTRRFPHGAGTITPDTVRDMLGLADRARVIDLFEAVMRGDIVQRAFSLLADQYGAGADPAAILRDTRRFHDIW